jgi:ubiquinone/menaquinone biosynthesis C-methylase UbiE
MSRDVERYFTERARTFDRLYDLPPLESAVNHILRRAVYQRFELTFKHAGDLRGKRVLDIGCGSGRYAVEFGRRGASEVVGVDFAEDMLVLARQYAEASQVSDRVHFERADFTTFSSPTGFDVAIAIGFFDYIERPDVVLTRIRAATRGRLLASFPADQPVRSWLRRRRYGSRGVRLRFYERDEVATLARSAGFGMATVLPLSAGHFLIADTEST